MTLVVDACALVAIICDEPDAERLTAALGVDRHRVASSIAVREAARALGRINADGARGGLVEVERYCAALKIVTVPISQAETAVAVDGHRRYGKGTGHEARLTMGDCFAYAGATTNNTRLLYKGDDFIHTDLG